MREMVRRVAEAYPALRDGSFVLARQENLETIHRHSVVAERSGLLAEILAELETGEHSPHHMTDARVARGALAPRSCRRSAASPLGLLRQATVAGRRSSRRR